MPSIFEGAYHETVGIAGLHYIALGIGLYAAAQINARVIDRVYIHFKNKNGGVGEPEFRLRKLNASYQPICPPLICFGLLSATMVPGTIIIPIGLLLAGWSAQERVHWIVTDIGLAFVGAGIILVFQAIQTYIVDAFTLYAASGAFRLRKQPNRSCFSHLWLCSSRSGIMLPLLSRIWVPSVCAQNVREIVVHK